MALEWRCVVARVAESRAKRRVERVIGVPRAPAPRARHVRRGVSDSHAPSPHACHARRQGFAGLGVSSRNPFAWSVAGCVDAVRGARASRPLFRQQLN